MKELFILCAKMIPEEKLLGDLQEALTNYKIMPSDETKQTLTMNLILCSTRFSTEGQDMMDVIKDMDNLQKLSSSFKKEAKN